MRFLPACLSLLAISGATAFAATAFNALQLLPPEFATSIAVIAGRDATPEPEQWHFIVYDPKAESGVREIVVANGKRAANRTVSQFVESVRPGDVINPEALKVDSDQVVKLAMQFGVANKVTVSAMQFDLRKSGPEATPLWNVTCLDSSGTELGKLVVSATRGTVIMHPGFMAEPPSDLLVTTNSKTKEPRTTPPPLGEDSDATARQAPKKDKPAVVKKKPATPASSTPRPNLLQRMFGGPH